ncbi:LuxR C-terminal-related transcriptional regulator [Streptomonospora arabica]|uniref:LuxR C-terminal-related transcriptional regulator n=1 Tax=Streptomonospora arabica TaxID=412417 RepID=A0ABV9SSE7_9ACTN
MPGPPPPPPTEGARTAARESVAERNTSRAFEVAALLAQGRTRGEIAAELGVHPNTVSTYARATGARCPRKKKQKEPR